MVLQKLTKEEVTNTYGGKTVACINWVVIDGKLCAVVGKKEV